MLEEAATDRKLQEGKTVLDETDTEKELQEDKEPSNKLGIALALHQYCTLQSAPDNTLRRPPRRTLRRPPQDGKDQREYQLSNN